MTPRQPPPRQPLLIEMSPDGTFRPPPGVPITTRLIAGAVVVAVLCGLVAVAAIALWVALMLIPVAIGAALVAWVLITYRRWRARATGRGVRWPIA